MKPKPRTSSMETDAGGVALRLVRGKVSTNLGAIQTNVQLPEVIVFEWCGKICFMAYQIHVKQTKASINIALPLETQVTQAAAFFTEVNYPLSPAIALHRRAFRVEFLASKLLGPEG